MLSQELPSWLVQLPSLQALSLVAILLICAVGWIYLAVYLAPLAGFVYQEGLTKLRRQGEDLFPRPDWPACGCHGREKEMRFVTETPYGELYACPKCPAEQQRGMSPEPRRFPFLDGGDPSLTLASGRIVQPFAQQPEGLLVASPVGAYTVAWEEFVPDRLPAGDLATWVSSGVKERA